MLIKQTRLRTGRSRPLRVIVGDYWTPINFFKIYFVLIGFYGFFEFLFVAARGWGFMGVHGRPFTLGMFLFIGGIAVYLIANRRKMVRHNSILKWSLLGFFLVEAFVLTIMGLQNGIVNGNVQLTVYQQGLLVVLFVTTFAYLGVESQYEIRNVVHYFIWFLLALSVANALAFLINLLPAMPTLTFFSLDFLFVLPLAGLYFFANYLLAERWKLWNLALFIAASSGILLRFQKPVLVPFIAACGVVFLLVFFLTPRFDSITKKAVLTRMVFLLLFGVLFILLLNFIAPGNVLAEFRLLFFTRYLKLNPFTAEAIGRVDGGRIYLVTEAWEMIEGTRLWGLGFGTGIKADTGDVIFPHNLVVDFLIGTGLLGVALLLSMMVAIPAYIASRINWRRYGVLKMGLVGFLIYVLIVSMVGVFWGHLGLIHVFALLLGITLKLTTMDGEQQLETRSPARQGVG